MKNIILLLISIFLVSNAFAQEPTKIHKSGQFHDGETYTIKIIEKKYIKTPDSK
jgi:hypothetical protein